ncbi:NUDIX hydrolase [Lactovum odontotermitis]
MKKITATDVYGKEYTISVDNLSQSVHVYGIAKNDEKVLILPQYDGYNFPGGTREAGETHHETLKREFFEETGLTVENGQLLAIYDSFYHDPDYDISEQSLLIFYTVEITGGEISDQGFDEAEKKFAKKAQWKTLAELRQMRLTMNVDIADELLTIAEDL